MPTKAAPRNAFYKAVMDKIEKTGQTRGASDSEIFQNRVARSGTVLIALDQWEACSKPDDGTGAYENGSIVVIPPRWYFTTEDADAQLQRRGIELGVNALLVYRLRADWVEFGKPYEGGNLPNGKPFKTPETRLTPIGGTYIARVHKTTSKQNGAGVNHGCNTSELKGAGIRVYEYASSAKITNTRLQLESLFWMCYDSVDVMVESGQDRASMVEQKNQVIAEATDKGMLDVNRIRATRMVDDDGVTVCPLCLERLTARMFGQREAQAKGRETHDNTITQVSLFHIEELRLGRLSHKEYNLGWGHNHCNTVVKDAGIIPTLKWMKQVMDNNGNSWQKIEEAEKLVDEGIEG